HLVVEEGPAPCPTPDGGRPRVVVWSARDAATGEVVRTGLAEHFGRSDGARFDGARFDGALFADTVATLQQGRPQHAYRAALVCRGSAGAAEGLADGGHVLHGTAGQPPRIGFVFAAGVDGADGVDGAAGVPVLPDADYGVHLVLTEAVDGLLHAL